MDLHSKSNDTILTVAFRNHLIRSKKVFHELYSANKNDDEVALFLEKCEGGSLQDGLSMQEVTQ